MLRPDSTVGFLECPALQRRTVNIQRERRQPAAAGARMQPGCNCSLPFIPRRGLGCIDKRSDMTQISRVKKLLLGSGL